MNADTRKSGLRSATHKSIDDDAQAKIILSLRHQQQQQQQQQQSNHKQGAQDRLKRLQSNLRQINSKKEDKDRWSTRSCVATNSNSSSNGISGSITSQAQRRCNQSTGLSSRLSKGLLGGLSVLRPTDKPKISKPPVEAITAGTAVSFHGTTRNKLPLLPAVTQHYGRNAWAKPKALLDASNRLERDRSKSANQRLVQLRDSLQRQQHKETNNNNNNNDAAAPSKKLPETTAPSQVRINPAPVSVQQTNYDDMEPMDVDGEEEDEDNAPANNSSSSCSGVLLTSERGGTKDKERPRETLVAEQQQPAEVEQLDKPLLRLLSSGQELPARRLDHMYFVLDTNVLLYSPVFVEDLCHVALGATKGSMLYIPYIVIKELDKLKDGRNENEVTRSAAIRAIRYLNDKFDNSLKIQAQSAMEEAEHLIEVDCPDDSIVNCCLQLKAQVPHLMLLTNDNNLRLKANASAIKVSCRSDLLSDHRAEFDALPS